MISLPPRRGALIGTILLALTLSACSSTSIPGTGSVSDSQVLEKIEAQEFPFCDWVRTALATADPVITLDLQPPPRLDQPLSALLKAGGTEKYSTEGAKTLINCTASAEITDVTGFVTITLAADPGGLEEINRSGTVEHRGRTIGKFYPGVSTDVTDHLRVSVTLDSNADDESVAQTNTDWASVRLLEALIDTWDDGHVQKILDNTGGD